MGEIKQLSNMNALRDEEVAAIITGLAAFDGNLELVCQDFALLYDGKQITAELVKKVQIKHSDLVLKKRETLTKEGKIDRLFSPLGRMRIYADLLNEQRQRYASKERELKKLKVSLDLDKKKLTIAEVDSLRRLAGSEHKILTEIASFVAKLTDMADALDCRQRALNLPKVDPNANSATTGAPRPHEVVVHHNWDAVRTGNKQ